ncbi:MAG: hypothetical protein WD226_12705 [Planctomycetota bacterium]
MTSEPAAATAPSALGTSERPGVVFWLAGGLLGLAGLVAAVVGGLFQSTEAFDSTTLFAGGAPPAPWTLDASEQHAGGTWIVRLRRDREPADASGEPAPEAVVLLVPKSRELAERWLAAGDAPGGGGPGGGPPTGPPEVDALERWRADPSSVEPFTRVLAREPLAWNTWEAPATRVRYFQQDGTWIESVRVDVSQPPRRQLVVVARWPAGEVADIERLRPLLDGLCMLD